MVVLGRVIEPYGLHGWVKIHLFGDDAAGFGGMPQWWLAGDVDNPAVQWAVRPLTGFRQHGKGYIARFAGFEDRTAAESIDGCYIAAPRTALPPTVDDEYYWADLVGLAVANVQGEKLGVVSELMAGGAHDVLCVRGIDAQERLLPFVGQVVKRVDLTKREIVVDWGLDW